MHDLTSRFLVGGAVVSFFAILGDALKPKSFSGLFGAASSVALATLSLTVSANGKSIAAIEARSMIVGAAAFSCLRVSLHPSHEKTQITCDYSDGFGAGGLVPMFHWLVVARLEVA